MDFHNTDDSVTRRVRAITDRVAKLKANDLHYYNMPVQEILPGMKQASDINLLAGAAPVFLEARKMVKHQVNAAAIQSGIGRATEMLQNAATLSAAYAGGYLRVTVTNQCGHKLPTGYPEGRRIWLNVRFFDEWDGLLSESGAYDTETGVLTRDLGAKIYEVHGDHLACVRASERFVPKLVKACEYVRDRAGGGR